jgi:hypothetical protein
MPKTTAAASPPTYPHLDELAHILALGIVRLRRRREANNSKDLREFPLDFPPGRSGHAASRKRKERRP